MTPTLAAPAATEAKSLIQGMEQLQVPPAAVGAAPDPTPETRTEQVIEQPAQPQATPDQTLETEDLFKQNEKLQEFLERKVSQAITGARKKWDDEILQKKLLADRQQRDEAMLELARKAESGDEEALKQIGQTTVAQVLRKTSTNEVLQQWFAQANETIQRVSGGNADLVQRLALNNFPTVPDWIEEVAKVRVEQAEVNFKKDLEKLSEAKAADIVTARRQQLPVTDTTQPVAAGGSPRKWKTLGEAARMLNDDEISIAEYGKAAQLYKDGQLEAGVFQAA